MKVIAAFLFGITLGVGSVVIAAEVSDLQNFLAKNKIGMSPDYGLVKQGYGGMDHLATIHGYADDESVCENLANEHNGDDSKSVLPGRYFCIKLNE